VAAIESYGRLYRLTQNHAPVTVEINVETKFTGEHEHGFDTVAEIPGTDPKLKDQVVMVGGHLDSWIAGTGATDNGAGTVVAMEAVRILKALDIKPRRTIRIALWTGEEQGIFGSKGYARALRLGAHLHRSGPDAAAGVHAPRRGAARPSSRSRSSSPATSTSTTAPARFAASTRRATTPSRPSSRSGLRR
jgi:carboxypeptidase Q